MSAIVQGLFLIGLGCLEGYTFSRVGMLPPQVMDDQMVFRSFIIMKLFISAVGASMLFQGIMSLITPDQFFKSRFYAEKTSGYVRTVIGAVMLGVGMELAGSGPTILPSQIAAGVTSGPIILAGMISGGILWAIAEPLLFDIKTCSIPKPGQKLIVEQIIGGRYGYFAIPGGFMMLLAVVLMEIFLPHKDELQTAGVPISNPTLPIFAGIVIGANQIALRYITEDGQGGSTSIMNVISTLTFGKISTRHQIADLIGAAQLLYVWVGTCLGSLAGSDLPDIDGHNVGRSFVGGALMLVGGRIALGCTCGRSISGVSELSLESFAAMIGTFGGAIVTGFIINYAI